MKFRLILWMQMEIKGLREKCTNLIQIFGILRKLKLKKRLAGSEKHMPVEGDGLK